MHSQSTTPPGTQTLRRGLDVVAAVARGATGLRAVCERTGISRSTAHRLLQLLVQEGYLRRGPESTYLLGPALIEYGFLALQQNPVPLVARPVLERLSGRFQDTVHLAIRDHDEVLYLDKIASLRGAETRSRIGYRMPLTTTGIGKSLILDEQEDAWERLFAADGGDGGAGGERSLDRFLEAMRRYRRLGATMDLEENEPGIRCVAAPIRDGSSSGVAAVSISATRPYMPMERMRALVPVLREAAEEISGLLGYPAAGPRD
ncbi:IclR family transcriptional regulator [Nocardiopsis sp. NPDC058631]|uniref:IclR family transcriptional regulator n=1 Tax=Nocardiopsis sp. NPDC058631 TaxID=3346566 RepID=UPI003658D56C